MTKKKKSSYEIPEPTLRRLPWYLAYVKLLQSQGTQVVSSTFIARSIGIDSALVAKDLSFVNISGKTRVGYQVDSLVTILEEFLGFNMQHKAYLFGVGNLGAALLSDRGLLQYGLEIVAGFDVDPGLCHTTVAGIRIYHIDELKEIRDQDVTIGILSVPVERAQEVTDRIVESGIGAIWNFTPYRITVPQDVVVQNTSMYSHLAVMFNRLKELTKKAKQ